MKLMDSGVCPEGLAGSLSRAHVILLPSASGNISFFLLYVTPLPFFPLPLCLLCSSPPTRNQNAELAELPRHPECVRVCLSDHVKPSR